MKKNSTQPKLTVQELQLRRAAQAFVGKFPDWKLDIAKNHLEIGIRLADHPEAVDPLIYITAVWASELGSHPLGILRNDRFLISFGDAARPLTRADLAVAYLLQAELIAGRRVGRGEV